MAFSDRAEVALSPPTMSHASLASSNSDETPEGFLPRKRRGNALESGPCKKP